MDKKLTTAEIVTAVSGLAIFVFSFFDYYKAEEFDFSQSGWDEFPLYTYGALFGGIAAAAVLLSKLGNVQLPRDVLGFSWVQLHMALAVFSFLVLLGLFLGVSDGADAGIGLIVGLLGSIGLIVGAVMMRQERTSGPSF